MNIKNVLKFTEGWLHFWLLRVNIYVCYSMGIHTKYLMVDAEGEMWCVYQKLPKHAPNWVIYIEWRESAGSQIRYIIDVICVFNNRDINYLFYGKLIA